METFAVKFRAGSLDLDAIVTAYDHHRQFKVEMITDEPEPIILDRSIKGEWQVIDRGTRNFSDMDFEQLENAITAQLDEIYLVKNMLVLTDFSDAALNAARYAAALTQQLKTANLILYHSYESITVPAITFAPVSPGAAESPELSLEKIRGLKDDLGNLIAEATKIEVRTDERPLVTAVNTLTRHQHIGLVAAGITGKSNMEKILIGSNTLLLAKNCSAPLLVIPPAATYKPVRKVVFACDLKQVSASTPVHAIKSFVHALGAKLLILNVDRGEKHTDPDTIKEITDLHQIWDNEQPEHHYTDHEDIAEGIMDFADQQHAELVITVPKAYGFFESIFHRSMTNKLAYHTHLPLLLFKEDQ